MHRDLLEQARHLATRDRSRPKQSNLRRAVSSAYYALFHLLVHEAAEHLLRGKGQAKFRLGLGRAFTHADLKNASRAFVSGGTLPVFGTVTVPKKLKQVAQAVIDLQTARHDADYDLSQPFTRAQVLGLVGQAEAAFAAWERVRRQDVAYLYLAVLLTYRSLTGRER